MVKKNKKNLVSVIINCFNGEEYLKDAVESVIKQTHKNWEIIFWDNLSNDGSASIIKSYNDKRIKYYLAKKFTNLHRARNQAIKKCNGSFITFLDTDDVWESTKLKLQLKKFQNKNINFVYGNCWLINDSYIFKKKIFSNELLPIGQVTKLLLKNNFISLPTIMIRKLALKKLKYFFDERYKIIGDFDLSFRLSLNNQFECIQEPIANYRIHVNSYSYQNRETEIKELIMWFKRLKRKKLNKKLLSTQQIKEFSIRIKMIECLYGKRNTNLLKKIYFLTKNLNIFGIKILLKLLLPKMLINTITVYGK